ncbi:unnamed protein product [Trichobilharzia szidati]|nr:unnamed protein product [Trichobilharzia szidati]
MLFLNFTYLFHFIMVMCTIDYLIRAGQTSASITNNLSYKYLSNNKSSEYLKMNSLQRMNSIIPHRIKPKSDSHQPYIIQRSRKDVYARLPSIEECISDQYNYAVMKGCLCYLFQSTGLSNGSFEYMSKTQSRSLWNSTKCLIYTFVGDLSEIVHIRLLEFSLAVKKSKDFKGIQCTTKFRVYHQLERAELMYNDQPDYELCSSHINQLPVHEFYSTGRVLIIELDGIITTGMLEGKQKFLGLFEFIDKDAYRSDGLPIKSTKCDRIFLSPSYKIKSLSGQLLDDGNHDEYVITTTSNADDEDTSMMKDRRDSADRNKYKNNNLPNSKEAFLHTKANGKFFPPNYPQFYNTSMTCKYYFLAKTNERIVISLKNIQLWSNNYNNCHSTSQRDTIHFHEIVISLPDRNSILHLEDIIEQPPIYELRKRLLFLCGSKEHADIVSDSLFVMLTLQTHEKSSHARGFQGSYHFLSKGGSSIHHYNQYHRDNNNDNNYNGREGHVKQRIDEKLYRDPAVKELSVAEADQSIRNSSIPQVKQIWMNPAKLYGTIESPNYPLVYPQNMKLLFIINIPEGKSLQLKFLDFNLGDQIPNTKCSQDAGDRIEIYEQNYSHNHQSKMIFCGKSISEKQKTLIINNNNNQYEMKRVYIQFITDDIITSNERGFILSYKYIDQNHMLLPSTSSSSAVLYNSNYYPTQNKYNLVRKDLSDETSEMRLTDAESCEFTISSNGIDSTGYIRIPQDLLSTQKSTDYNQINNNNIYNKLNNCKWKLKGNFGQRIQIRFIKRLESSSYYSQSHGTQSGNGYIQQDQEFHNVINKENHNADIDDVQGIEASFINSLRCPTSMTLELINYRANALSNNNNINQLMTDKLKTSSVFQQNYSPMNLERISPILPKSSSSSSMTPHSTDYTSHSPIPSDPVRLCAGEFMLYSPASKGFMSGSIPLLDIILRINKSTVNDAYTGDRKGPIFANLQYPNFGYDVQYRFVTGCFFEFNRSQSMKGNFTSPNYPGLYPIDLTCEYRFFGINVKRIDIVFLEFDVESTSKTCTDDTMGDSVEISSCYPVELLTSPKRRLCHRQSHLSPYKIQWYEPCLNLKFFSNGMYVRTGFLGVYEFHDAGEIGKKINKILIIFLCIVVNSLHYLIT